MHSINSEAAFTTSAVRHTKF